MDEKLYRMDGNSVSPVSYSFFDTEDKLQALIAENPDEVRPDFAACTEKLVNYALGCGLPVHYGRGMIYASMDVSINGAWLYQIQSLDHDIGVFVSYANLSSKLGGALSPEQILEMFSPLGRDGHPLSYSMLYIKLRVSDLAAGDNLSVFLSQCDRILNIYREHSKSLIPPPALHL